MDCFALKFLLGVALLIAVSVSAVPISDEVDQVPPLPTERALPRDDGVADLKPPPPPSAPDNESQYSGSQATSSETLVYDPSIYAGLLPGGIPGYPDPFPAGYPQPYPGYPQHPPGYPTPYVVQTGYEGFLMPSASTSQSVQTAPLSESLGFLQGIIPSGMLTWIAKSMAIVMGTVTMVIMGGALTTALCSLTPICSVSFKSLKFLNWNETARNVGMLVGTEMTPERVRRAANFVHQAIRKYSELQKAFASDDTAVHD